MKRLITFLLLFIIVGCEDEPIIEVQVRPKLENETYEVSHICNFTSGEDVIVENVLLQSGEIYVGESIEVPYEYYDGKKLNFYVFEDFGSYTVNIDGERYQTSDLSTLMTVPEYEFCRLPGYFIYRSESIFTANFNSSDKIELFEKVYEARFDWNSEELVIDEITTIYNSEHYYAFYNDEQISLLELITMEDIPYEIWNNMMESFGDNAMWSEIVRTE